MPEARPNLVGAVVEDQIIVTVIVFHPETKERRCCLGLIDTGATQSVIANWIVEELNISPIGNEPVITVDCEKDSDIYKAGIRVIIPTSAGNRYMSIVCECTTWSGWSICEDKQRIDVLIGMDIIMKHRLVVEGNRFEFGFPSGGTGSRMSSTP